MIVVFGTIMAGVGFFLSEKAALFGVMIIGYLTGHGIFVQRIWMSWPIQHRLKNYA